MQGTTACRLLLGAMPSCLLAWRRTLRSSHSSSSSKIHVSALPVNKRTIFIISSPDIERMYGKPKAIAKRTPLFPSNMRKHANSTASSSSIPSAIATPAELELVTPAATEGDTATETDLETEVEEEIVPATAKANSSCGKSATSFTKMSGHVSQLSNASSNGDIDMGPNTKNIAASYKKISRHVSQPSNASSNGDLEMDPNTGSAIGFSRKFTTSQHDLLNKYFRRDVVVLRNLDLLRYILSWLNSRFSLI